MLIINNKALKVGNKWLNPVVSPEPTPPTPVDPYNPLGLPPRTIRIEFDNNRSNNILRSGVSLKSGCTMTQVDGRIYDFTYDDNDWTSLFEYDLDYLVIFDNRFRILGANTSTVTCFDCWMGVNGIIESGTSTGEYAAYCYEIVNVFDTSNATNISCFFASICARDTSWSTAFGGSMEILPDFPFDSAQNVYNLFNGFTYQGVDYGATNLKSGILSLYQKLSSQGTVTTHTNAFTNAGKNTTTGAAELAQIPSDWK